MTGQADLVISSYASLATALDAVAWMFITGGGQSPNPTVIRLDSGSLKLVQATIKPGGTIAFVAHGGTTAKKVSGKVSTVLPKLIIGLSTLLPPSQQQGWATNWLTSNFQVEGTTSSRNHK